MFFLANSFIKKKFKGGLLFRFYNYFTPIPINIFKNVFVFFSVRHKMIKAFVAKGGDLRDLYYGKTNLEDLETVKKVKGLKSPMYLPAHLRKD